LSCQKAQPKTRRFTWEKGTVIVIAQNRRIGGLRGKERKGGEGAEGLEDIRGKTNEGIRSLPHGGVSFEKMR
jgi:hypothetical protein